MFSFMVDGAAHGVPIIKQGTQGRFRGGFGDGLMARRMGLSLCLISPILKSNIINCEKNNWDKQKTVKDLILTIWTAPC